MEQEISRAHSVQVLLVSRAWRMGRSQVRIRLAPTAHTRISLPPLRTSLVVVRFTTRASLREKGFYKKLTTSTQTKEARPFLERPSGSDLRAPLSHAARCSSGFLLP